MTPLAELCQQKMEKSNTLVIMEHQIYIKIYVNIISCYMPS